MTWNIFNRLICHDCILGPRGTSTSWGRYCLVAEANWLKTCTPKLGKNTQKSPGLKTTAPNNNQPEPNQPANQPQKKPSTDLLHLAILMTRQIAQLCLGRLERTGRPVFLVDVQPRFCFNMLIGVPNDVIFFGFSSFPIFPVKWC